MKKELFLLFFAVFVAHIFFRIYSYKDQYTLKYDSGYWKDRYLRSQWVSPSGCSWDPHINPKTCVWDDSWYAAHQASNYKPVERESIGDDGVYAYAGWEYMQGKDPTLLNAEMPPFGKYLIGLSIEIFRNQNIFAVFSGILALIALYLLSTVVIKDKKFAFLPVVFFSFEPIFYTQLRAPFLDLLYLSLLCFSFYFILKNNLVVSLVVLGLAMATKASLVTFGMVVCTSLFYLIISRKLNLVRKYILLFPVALGIFAFTYFRFFLLGHGVIDFLKVQKWIINFYSAGAKGNYGDIFQILLTGKWLTWWDKTISEVSEWQVTWPILFVFTICMVIIQARNKKVNASTFLAIWVIAYLIFLFFVPVFPRYLLVVIPFLYITFVKMILSFIKFLHEG